MTRTPPPISSFQASPLDDLKAELEVFVQEVAAQQKEHIFWEGLPKRNICVGEAHSQVASKRFLITNMKFFKKSGFNVIFMEHLSKREDSSSLERYERNEEMPQELKARLATLDRQFQSKLYPEEWGEYNFTKIVEAAKRHGIKVIPLEESEESYQSNKNGLMRAAILSLNAKNAIDLFNKSGQGGKWLALVGSAHLNRCRNIPGICDIVNAQDLLITDANEDNKVFLPLLRVCQSPTETPAVSYEDVDGSKLLLNVSMSLIIDPRSDMSYEAISSNELLRTTAENLSSSSSSFAAAAEDREVKKPRQEEGQKESKESEEYRSRLEKEAGPSGYFPIPTEAQRVKDKAKGNSSSGKGL
jgi:hypothetical protein